MGHIKYLLKNKIISVINHIILLQFQVNSLNNWVTIQGFIQFCTVNAWIYGSPFMHPCTLFRYEIHVWKRMVYFSSVYGKIWNKNIISKRDQFEKCWFLNFLKIESTRFTCKLSYDFFNVSDCFKISLRFY